MVFSDKERRAAVRDLNIAINEVVCESGGVLDRFRGRVPLCARIFEFREIDK